MKSRIAITCLWLAGAITLHLSGADFAARPRPLANFDKRPIGPRTAPEKNPAGRTALAEMQRADPAVRVEWDAVLGTPNLVSKPDGFLTEAAPPSVRAATAAISRGEQLDAVRVIRSYLDRHSALFGHGSEGVSAAVLQRDDVTPGSGLRTVIWQQQIQGIPVFEGMLSGHVTKQGELVSLSSRFMPEAEAAAGRATLNQPRRLAEPKINAIDAVTRAATTLGEAVHAREIEALPDGAMRADKRQYFQGAALKGKARAKLAWLPMSRTKMVLCWQVDLTGRRQGRLYRVLVEAQTGEALVRRLMTVDAAEASYRVFTTDSPTPFSPAYATPSMAQPPAVERQLISVTALSTNASPNGWIDPGMNELRGNNVDAHLDRNDDDVADAPRTRGAPARVFDFKLDLSKAPSASADAAVTELFYWCNWMHDQLYELGFTESAGNFQKLNFGRGGVDGDAIEADAQDGGGVNNSNFSTLEDGEPGRVQMYLFDGPAPDRDGAFDTEVILHELTHGLSLRLVGGGTGLSALQAQGLGEGWSDFYALSFLSEASDDPSGNYAFGGYTAYQIEGLVENYYYGIRHYPYSTALRINPLTFKDVDPAQIDPHLGIPKNPLFQSADSPEEVHHLGEIWCAMLWDCRANLVGKHGFGAGNQLMLQLTTDGMKLTPPEPTFLQARDAIIQADLVRTGGANREELWRGFARRGLGYSATSPDSSTTRGVEEAFDLPDDLRIAPRVGFSPHGPEAGPFVPEEANYVLTNSGTNAVKWSASKSTAWLDLIPSAGEIQAGPAAVTVKARLNEVVHELPPGVYKDLITFSNQVTSRVQTRAVVLRVGQPDTFTQVFQNEENTLDFQSFTFTPDGSESFYAVCREAADRFPTDPTLGTLLEMTDEASAKLDLAAGGRVALYGEKYGTLYVSANGYITFSGSVSEFTESIANHFSRPRLSMLHDDLDPSQEGSVSWVELDDHIAITFENVPNFFEFNSNSFQVELFFDGRIRLTYLEIDTTGGLVGLSRGGGVPPNFAQSRFQDYALCGPMLALELPTTAKETDAVLSGLVTLPGLLPRDLLVNFTSLIPAVATVPATLTIRAGSSSAEFAIQLHDNAELDGTKAVRISASAPGFRDGSALLRVQDNETAALSVEIPRALREGDGLLGGQGLVTMSPVPQRSVVVNLRSSDPNELAPAPAVIIPAGASSARFDLEVKDDGVIDGPREVQVLARVDNWREGSATAIVADNEARQITVTMQSQVGEGAGLLNAAGTIRLGGTLDRDFVVFLSSNAAQKLTVPETVIVPSGQSFVPFDVRVLDDDRADGPQKATIRASAPDFLAGEMEVIINDDETPPVPAGPDPAHLATNAPPSLVLRWSTGEGELIANGGFETGDLSGWERENTGEGGFVINDGQLDPAGPDDPSAPLAGGFEVMSQQSGPGHHVLSREVTIPAGALSARLSWSDRIRNHAALFAAPSQQFRVEIRSTTNEVLATAFATDDATPLLNDWTRRNFDLSAFIGQTVRIAFVQEERFGFLNVHLDDISLFLRPAGPTTYDVYWGEEADPSRLVSLGSTMTNQWPLVRLDLAKTYFWKVSARRGPARTDGPVWQFSVPGVGPLDHFAWNLSGSTQFLDQPFPVTVAAKDLHETTLTNFNATVGLAAEARFADLEVGSGTNQWESPLGGFYSDSRTQVLYLPEELGSPRRLTALALFVNTPRNLPLNRLTIRMKHSPLRKYPEAAAWERSGWTTVFQKTVSLSDRGWVKLPLNVPFAYDGINSLMVDFSFKDAGFSGGGDCRSALVDEPRAITYQSFGWVGDPLGWSGSRSPMPEIERQIPIVRFSSANAIDLAPLTTGRFQDGTWTGEVRFLTPSTNVVLRADDGEGHLGETDPVQVGAPDNLRLSASDAPDPVTVTQSLEYTIGISNSGPSAARGVVLTDRIPAEFTFVAAMVSQGTFDLVDGLLRCEFGTIDGEAAANATVLLQASARAGVFTNRLEIQRAELEKYTVDDRLELITTVVPRPAITMDDLTVEEGNLDGTNAVFSLHLSGPSSELVTVAYSTSNATASSGTDYLPRSGTIEFAPGVTARTITIPVVGDALDETDETFNLNLASPSNATLGRARAIGHIVDDDGPTIQAVDIAVTEGNRGRTNCVFALSLSSPSPQTVTVNYVTADGSASEGADYEAQYGTVTFRPGITSQAVTIPVKGDTFIEPNERFYLAFYFPTNGILARKQVIATIVNDDGLPGNLDHFEWEETPSPQVVNEPFRVTLLAKDALGHPATNFSGRATLAGEVPHPDVTIGEGKVPWSDPVDTYFEDARVQMIYLASEMAGPRQITGLALNFRAVPEITLNRWTIRLKHTSLSGYAETGQWERTGWTVCYQNNESFGSPGWITFPFSRPFEYDGVSNLMIDFSFNNSDYHFGQQECLATATETARALWSASDSEFGDPLNWNGLTAFPEVQKKILNLQLQSRIPVAIAPTTSGDFENGVWRGEMTVSELAAGMVLRADDGNNHGGVGNRFSTSLINDLALSASASPSPVTVGRPITYRLTVENSGPNPSSGVVVSNRWPVGVNLVSATTSQGTWTEQTGAVLFQLGTIPGGGNASLTILLNNASTAGILTNRATVTRTESDGYLANNSVITLTPAYFRPSISVSDTSLIEGSGPETNATFTIKLSDPSSEPIEAEFLTVDGTAVAGDDYVAASGKVTFPPGTTRQSVQVRIVGDTSDEADETFSLKLLNPVNGVVLLNQGACRIIDDDGPVVSVNRLTVPEGESGTQSATFTVRLSAPSPQIVTVGYATSDDTATEGSDYTAASGVLRFIPGTSSLTVSVKVLGDIVVEPDEAFLLGLTGVTNATIQANGGVCTILNDDGLPGVVDHFDWNQIAAPQYVNQPFPVWVVAKDSANDPVTNFVGTAAIEARIVHPDSTIGDGTGTMTPPFDTGYEMARAQVIYLAAEIGAARRITALALNVSTPPATILHRWTIRMKHTSLGAYGDAPVWERASWTTVYQADAVLEESGWATFELARPFDFDGTHNLMVDFSFANPDTNFRTGECVSTDTPDARCLASGTYQFLGNDPLVWTGATPEPEPNFQVPDIRLSSISPVAVEPIRTASFTEGQWLGTVSMGLSATNVTLRLVDSVGHTGTSVPFVIRSWVDTDGDGLPDDWESANGLAVLNSNDGLDDSDGDGANNFHEFLVGSNPQDRTSLLRLHTTTVGSEGPRLEFPSALGRLYQIQSSSDLGAKEWMAVGSVIVGTGELIRLPIASPGESVRYFRVRLFTAQ